MSEPVTFPWQTLESIVGGSSALDVPRLHLRDLSEAEAFLECYGFSWKVASHRRELDRIRRLSLAFFDEVLLVDEPRLVMPEELRRRTDVRRFLLWASQSPDVNLQRWSCSLLRVMHTIAHADNYLNERFGPDVRDQILNRFKPHLHTDEHGQLYLGRSPSDRVALVSFETKGGKSLWSVVTKLLHKVENVAADVFDWIGVRFVTQARFDALLVVRYLRAHNVIMFANVKPSRSRNTLIDLDFLREASDSLDHMNGSGELTREELLQALREKVCDRAAPEANHSEYNVFSSSRYNSIQFTCRQLIRVPRAMVSQEGDAGELRFFFPFEVQILDHDSYQRSRSGMASHEIYKARQRLAVKRRVLGPLMGHEEPEAVAAPPVPEGFEGMWGGSPAMGVTEGDGG